MRSTQAAAVDALPNDDYLNFIKQKQSKLAQEEYNQIKANDREYQRLCKLRIKAAIENDIDSEFKNFLLKADKLVIALSIGASSDQITCLKHFSTGLNDLYLDAKSNLEKILSLKLEGLTPQTTSEQESESAQKITKELKNTLVYKTLNQTQTLLTNLNAVQDAPDLENSTRLNMHADWLDNYAKNTKILQGSKYTKFKEAVTDIIKAIGLFLGFTVMGAATGVSISFDPVGAAVGAMVGATIGLATASADLINGAGETSRGYPKGSLKYHLFGQPDRLTQKSIEVAKQGLEFTKLDMKM